MKKQIDVAAQRVTFTFDNGIAPISLAMSQVSPECATYAMLHGFSARIGDNAALSRKDAVGNVITITEQMRADAVQELVTYYASGAKEWATRAAAVPKQNPAIATAATKNGKTYAEMEAIIANLELDKMAE